MAKLKKQILLELQKAKAKLFANRVTLGIMSLLLLAGLANIAVASNAFNWGNVERDVANQIAGDVLGEEEEPVLSGMVSPVRYNQIECDNDYCTANVSVSAINASTTIFAVVPPFRMATSTGNEVVVETDGSAGIKGWTIPTTTLSRVAISVDGAATTTYSVMCASASTKFATSSASVSILETGIDVTSTPYLLNNMTAANSDGGYLTGSVERIFLTPTRPYVICKVNPSDADAFTNAENTFTADATFTFERLQR